MKNYITNTIANCFHISCKDIPIYTDIRPQTPHFTIPCLRFSKLINIPVKEIIMSLNAAFNFSIIKKTEYKDGFFNIFVENTYYCRVVLENLTENKIKKNLNLGHNKSAIVEHTSATPDSSPHMGRARCAIIGDSLARLLSFVNYKVETQYFVNDLAKQVSMLVYSIGDEKNIQFRDFTKEYIKAYSLSKGDTQIEELIKRQVKMYEEGDKRLKEKFDFITKIFIKGQEEIYNKFNIFFDKYVFESKYIFENSVEQLLERLKTLACFFIDKDGRYCLDLEKWTEGTNSVFVLCRSDSSSLYSIRDLCYSIEKFQKKTEINIVVLGEDQKLHYKQSKYVLELLGYTAPKPVFFSKTLTLDGNISTKAGKIVLLEDVMQEAEEAILKKSIKKRSQIKPIDAKKIAYGCIKYAVLKNSLNKPFLFDREKILNFEGNSSMFIQYNYSRIQSILKKSKYRFKDNDIDFSCLSKDLELSLIKQISGFENTIIDCVSRLRLTPLTTYVYTLAKTFSSYYSSCKILILTI